MVRRAVSIVAAVGLVAAGLVVGATQADAGVDIMVINITKVVEGEPPPGATFAVRIECDTRVRRASFDAAGGVKQVFFNILSPSCSVSEPENGNASSTTFACEPVKNATCDTTSFEGKGQNAEVNITVTNTFVAPPTTTTTTGTAAPAAAEAVPATPTFTG